MTNDRSSDETRPVLVLLGVSTTVVVLVLGLALARIDFGGARAPSPDASNAIASLAAEATAPTAREDDAATAAETPAPPIARWIWSSPDAGPDDAATFTRRVTLDPGVERLHLHLSCDNAAAVLVDDREVATTTDWATPLSIDLTPHVDRTRESFTIEVRARNEGGPAGLLARVELHDADGSVQRVVSDASWTVEPTDDVGESRAAIEIADVGDAPWGTLAGFRAAPIDRDMAVPDGFIVELVHEVPASQGSWVSMTTDARGRLLVSDQRGALYRVTPAPIGSDPLATRVEPIDVPVGAAQGLLCIEDDLYCMVAGKRADGEALYRVRDADGDDAYDEWELLWRLNGGGEHGPHGIVQGPDGLLYFTAGNHTRLPETDRSMVPRVWDEDHLLPRLWDARGHAVGLLAPGGWICRTDRDGSFFELVAIGFRNSYDIAFDRNGDLFAYDSDMEWDLGAPWYRPTRIVHVVSGADFGWRSGTGKWPAHSPDSVPPVLDIGPGSPTGVCFGYDTAFPGKYREALFAADWTFGTVYAVHLEPDGASHRATHEPFLTGRPLPVADLVANPVDGALYVVLGGRGVPSAIHRIRAIDRGAADGTPIDTPRLPDAHRVRRSLEVFHRDDAPLAAIEAAWPHLRSDDRFIAHAARTALEFQPAELWRDRLRDERDERTRIAASIALARVGEADDGPELIDGLLEIPFDDLSREERIAWLRGVALAIVRLGEPDDDRRSRLRMHVTPHYPSDDRMVDRALCELLVHLRSPVVVARTLAMMERADAAGTTPEEWFDRSLLSRNDTYGSVIMKIASATPQQQQIALALALRNATIGWTPELRRRYFAWFESARTTAGGLSFTGFLDQIRDDALARIPDDERGRYEQLARAAMTDGTPRPAPVGPGRQWTIDELAGLARDRLVDRDFTNGERMFRAAMCVDCHRVAGVGGASGPDLTAVATRFTLRDLVASIIEPSATISNQYEQTEFVLDDERIVIGRVVDMTDTTLRVMPSPLAPNATIEVERARIVSQRPSPVSSMMPRLLDALNEDEALDLLAYLLAEGDARNAMFRPAR